jgi:2-polyprenyl-3-methyl-5-hydroxy-6-metoxy-1,4-benzoquinol methylase
VSDANAFLAALDVKAKRLAPAARKTVADHEPLCRWLLDPLARWADAAYGPAEFESAARGYAEYCFHVVGAQRAYETSGEFNPKGLPEIVEHVYRDDKVMTPYMWAAVLIYAFWPSMVRHLGLYRDEFLSKLPANPRVLELACGHGVLGLLALEHLPTATLTGYDIGPAAIGIANNLKAASGHAARATFEVKDVLDLDLAGEAGTYQGVIAGMIAEHLAEPQRLFAAVAHHLAVGGRAFVSTALESAQRDHVYEFHRESEPLLMAEAAGLRVIDLISDRPANPVLGARFVPRAMAIILERRA